MINKDVTVEVIKIDEQEDGSAIVQLDMSDEALRLILEKGFIDILTEMIGRTND